MRKFIKYTSITFGVLLIFLISIPFLFENKIRTIAIRKLDEKINAQVYFKDLSISVFKHFPHVTLTLHNASVIGIGEFEGDTLVSAKEIDAGFDLFNLMKGRHEINGIHLLDPLIYARILKNGDASYDIVKQDTSGNKKAEESDFEIAIDKWSIENGRIIYDDKLQKTYIEVGGLYHSGSGDFKQEISDLDITTKVTELTFRYNGISYFNKKLFAADLQMEMNFKEKKFSFKDHDFQLGDFRFGFEGYFKLLKKGYESDLKFVIKETSFKNLLSILPGIYQKDMEGIETKGDIACNGVIKGIYNVQENKVPLFHIDIRIIDAMFKYGHLPKAMEKINFDFIAENKDGDPEHTIYSVNNFHFEIDKQSTRGKISVRGSKNMYVKADILSKLDLAEIEKFYPMEGLALKGNLYSEIKIDGIYNDSLHRFPTFDANVKVEKAMFKYKKLPKSVDNINLHLFVENKNGIKENTTFNIPVFHFDIDGNPVHGSASVSGLKDMLINADILLTADLAHLEKIYPVEGFSFKGIVNSEIKVKGRYNDSLKLFPTADVFVTIDKGYIKSKKYPVEMDSIHLNAEVTNLTGKLEDTQVSLNNFTFLLDDEPFVMNGTISDFKDYNYKMKIDGKLDIEKLMKLYPIEKTSAKGTMDFDLVTNGSLTQIESKNYEMLKSKGTLEMKDVSYKNSNLAFTIHIDDALFTFNSHKIELTRFTSEFGKSNISLSGHLYNYIPFLFKSDAPIKGDLVMKCDTMDLNEWFPSAAPSNTTAVAGSSSLPDSTRSAKPGSKAETLAIPGNLSFVFDSEIKKVKFGSLDISNLDGEIKIENGVLTLNETGFNALESKISISGDYNTKNIRHPFFDMDVKIDKMDFNKAYRTFVDPKGVCPASGNFSTKYSLKGEVTPDFSPVYSTLIGNGKITIDSVSVKGMKLMNHIKNVSKKGEFKDPTLNDVIIDSEIKKGKFLLYPFTFKVSKFLVELEGEQGLEDESINYFVRLSVPPFNKLRIPMTIKGTADKPIIKMGKGFDDSDFEKL